MQGDETNNTKHPTRLTYGTDSPSQFVLLQWPPFPSRSPRCTAAPMVFVVHGGFWRGKYGIDPPTAAFETVAPYLAQRGYLVCSVEYRRDNEEYGYGFSDVDVLRAVNFVLARFPSDNVSVVGHSAGGTLALSLLMHQKFAFKQMMLLAPVGDLCRAAALRLSDDGTAVQRYMRNASLPYGSGCPACCCAKATLTFREVPLIIVCGGRDTDVPPSYVRDFHSTLQRSGHPSCRYLHFENADHYEIADAGSSVWTGSLASYFPDIIRKKAEQTQLWL